MQDESFLPFFSVIILNWQSEKYLPKCLNALQKQSFKRFEVLLLDNGNGDSFQSDMGEQYPGLDLKVLRAEKNLGFAGGNNFAAQFAKGDYLVLLNADAFPSENWLEVIHEACLSHKDAFFASRLIKAEKPEMLDGEWNVYHATGLAWRQNHGQSISVADNDTKEVFSACAAAGVYPRAAFEEVQGFDEDFFAYMEDVDLDFRLQLRGYSCFYIPGAIVFHVGSGSTSPRSEFAVFHGHRNLIWTFVKNMPSWLFVLLLPGHIIVNLLYILASLFMGKAKVMASAKREAVRGLSEVFRKRRQIQKTKKVPASRIARLLNWNPFSPLIKTKF